MTNPITTVNSIKPITSAEPSAPPARSAGVAIVIAALAIGVAGVNLVFASAGRSIAAGLADLAAAEAQPIGGVRDQFLDRAQQKLRDGLALASGDAAGWDGLGEVRYLQATQASIRSVSPVLLESALDASRRARTLAPADADPPLRIAAILSRDEAHAAEALEALRASYALAPGVHTNTLRRAAVAGRLWRHLDAKTKAQVETEICAAAAQPSFARTFERIGSDIENPDAAAIERSVQGVRCKDV